MKNILKYIFCFRKKNNRKDEIEYRKKDLDKKLDRATNYSMELDKMLFNLSIFIFGAIVFGLQHFKIEVTYIINIFFILFMISIIFLFVSLFFSKWEKQLNIDLQIKYIDMLEDDYQLSKKEEEEEKQVQKLGKYIQFFSRYSYICFLLTGFMFFYILMCHIDKIK